MHCGGGLNYHGNHFHMEIYLSHKFRDDHINSLENGSPE